MEGLPEVTMVGRAHFFKLICEGEIFFKLICEGNIDIIHFHSSLALHSLVSYPLWALVDNHQYHSLLSLLSSWLSSLESLVERNLRHVEKSTYSTLEYIKTKKRKGTYSTLRKKEKESTYSTLEDVHPRHQGNQGGSRKGLRSLKHTLPCSMLDYHGDIIVMMIMIMMTMMLMTKMLPCSCSIIMMTSKLWWCWPRPFCNRPLYLNGWDCSHKKKG